MKKRILIIDDEIEVRELLKEVLESEGVFVETAAGGEQGLNLLEENYYHLAITDLKLPDISGMDILSIIKEKMPYCDVIVISAFPTVDTAVKAFKSGCSDYIFKPFDMEVIKNAVINCLEKQKFARDIAKLKNLVSLNDMKEIIDAFSVPGTIYARILELAMSHIKAQGGIILNIYRKNVPEISAFSGLDTREQGLMGEFFEKRFSGFAEGEIFNNAREVFGGNIHRVISRNLRDDNGFFGKLVLFRTRQFAEEFIDEDTESLADFCELGSYILLKYEMLKKEYFSAQ